MGKRARAIGSIRPGAHYRHLTGEDSDSFCEQATDWILKNLTPQYPWRGNIRELEQCVSSLLIRGRYLPPGGPGQDYPGKNCPDGAWTADAIEASISADQLIQRYCTWAYHLTGSYEATARRLKLDRRTVKAKLDPSMLQQLQDGQSSLPR